MKKLNYNQFITYAKNSFGFAFGVVTVILTFFSWDHFGINECVRWWILVAILIACAIYSIFMLLFKRKVSIWRGSEGAINVEYGDILKTAFKTCKIFKKSINRKIVVIPVNTHFDTIVESPSSNPYPLVSDNTIHGRWLSKYLKFRNFTAEQLQEEIYQRLDQLDINHIVEADRRGSKQKYEPGTCVLLPGNDATDFLLVAISEFDQKNNAQSNKDIIMSCVKSVIDFSDSHGQGRPCYIPLIGTGNSRAQLSHQESLHIILSTMDLYNDRIHYEMNVIIYKKDKDKVSIFDK